MQAKKKDEIDFIKHGSQETNYVEVHEELNRRRRESKLVEEALYQVVHKDMKSAYNQQQQEKLQRNQSLKKIYETFKHLVNPFKK